jgi:hypothetical protein
MGAVLLSTICATIGVPPVFFPPFIRTFIFCGSTRKQRGNCDPILVTVNLYRILQLHGFAFCPFTPTVTCPIGVGLCLLRSKTTDCFFVRLLLLVLVPGSEYRSKEFHSRRSQFRAQAVFHCELQSPETRLQKITKLHSEFHQLNRIHCIVVAVPYSTIQTSMASNEEILRQVGAETKLWSPSKKEEASPTDVLANKVVRAY